MIKKLALLLAAAAAGFAQNPYNTNIDLQGYFKATTATETIPFVPVTVNPTGTGCDLGQIVINTNTGVLTGCVGTTPTWSALTGGAISFGSITSGTNSTMAGICTTGCSIATSGTGINQGTNLIGLPGVALSIIGPTGSAPTVPSGSLGCWFSPNDSTEHCVDNSSNGSVMVRGLSTPASATAACTTPSISYDTSFLYVCKASNNWVSIPLMAFATAFPVGAIVGTTDTQTLTNKTIGYGTAVQLTGQTAAISSTALATPPSGGYRVCGYVVVTTAGTAGTMTGTFGWNDGTQAETDSPNSLASIPLTSLGKGTGCTFMKTNGTAINYSTTFTGATGTPAYSLYVTFDKLF